MHQSVRNFCMSVLFECLLQPSRVSAHCVQVARIESSVSDTTGTV